MFDHLPTGHNELTPQRRMDLLCEYYRTEQWRLMIKKHKFTRLLREIRQAFEVHIENERITSNERT